MSYLGHRIDCAKIDLQDEIIKYIKENIFREVVTEDEIDDLIRDLEDLTPDMLREKLMSEFNDIAQIAVPVYSSDISLIWSEEFSQLNQISNEYCLNNMTDLTKKMAILHLIEDELENSFESLCNGTVSCIIGEKLKDLENQLTEIYEEKLYEEKISKLEQL